MKKLLFIVSIIIIQIQAAWCLGDKPVIYQKDISNIKTVSLAFEFEKLCNQNYSSCDEYINGATEVVKKYLKEKGIEVVKQSKHVLVLTGIYEVKTNVSSYVATIPHTVETTYKGTATTGILEPSVEYTGKATSTYYEYENREFTSKNEYIWAEAMLVQNNKILAKTLERSGRNIVFYDSKPILFKDFCLEQVKSIWK